MITIDANVLTCDPDTDRAEEVFVVTGGFDPAVVIQALSAAAPRLYLVGDDGREYEDIDTIDANGIYSPNWVSEPKPTSDGIQVYIDCKGAITEEQTATFHRILREALDATGVDARVRVP